MRSLGGKLVKTQGVEVGTPDLMGSLKVTDVYGKQRLFPLALEVKKPETKNHVTAIQQHRLKEWHYQGWVALLVSSVDDFVNQFYIETGLHL